MWFALMNRRLSTRCAAFCAELCLNTWCRRPFIALDALPRTPNGKVDRGVLPAAATKRPPLSAAFTAPRTEVEELIAQEWRAALKLDRVGRTTISSISAAIRCYVMRVAGRLPRTLQDRSRAAQII